jgi:hypothetical protein
MRLTLKILRFASLVLGVQTSLAAYALGGPQYVHFSGKAGDFSLVQHGQATTILVDGADWPGVIRAAGDLASDCERVSGVKPMLLTEQRTVHERELILIGTLGHSPLIDGLVHAHKLDVSAIQGHWETAVTVVVANPLPGVRRALVIAGADKRGTIYGIYDLSEQIGVSPWYWWADVRIPHHAALSVAPGRILQPEPAVKYRGIFFNDESPALSGWAREKFGNLNSQFYTHVFELLLRLKANFLWPAMWNNAFATDDPLNPKLADEYGIVMSTSHEEPMMRAEKEWTWNVDKVPNHGSWNYSTNKDEIQAFWRKGMERDKNYEQVVTLGMRGENDTPMSESSNTHLLEEIVTDQRQILKQTVNPDLTKVPQVWALYKEVQGYYERGMRVPEDVTLLWSDDNWGNLRRLPTPEERDRSGGAGIYYHLDYVGGPRSYKWLNVTPITKVQEQMNLALHYGADRIWVVNVGDGKPMEFPIEFFLSMARTPDRWPASKLSEYTRLWATREFGSEHAPEIADWVEQYTRYNGRRHPELLEPTTFSLTNFHEADRVEADWKTLAAKVDKVAAELPEDERASFFELVQYPVDACANLNSMLITAGRNALAARLGDVRANGYAVETQKLFARDAELSAEYNHLLNGRWDHMMDQTHIGYTAWNDPPVNVMPAVSWTQIPDAGSLGVLADNTTYNPRTHSLSLGTVDSITQEKRTLELFNRGQKSVGYTIKMSAPWLKASSINGEVTVEQSVTLTVDWAQVPTTGDDSTVTVTSANPADRATNYTLHVQKLEDAIREGLESFVESNGLLSIEAPDTSSRAPAELDASPSVLHWVELPGFGATRSAMTVFPVDAPSDKNSAAALNYRMYLSDAGPFTLYVSLAPTNNFVPGRGLRFAVAIDDGPRIVVDALEHNTQRDWEQTVSDSMKKVSIPITVAAPGYHILHLYAVDPALTVERLVLAHGVLPPSYLGPPESFRSQPHESLHIQ